MVHTVVESHPIRIPKLYQHHPRTSLMANQLRAMFIVYKPRGLGHLVHSNKNITFFFKYL